MTRKRAGLTNGRLADAHHHLKRKLGFHFSEAVYVCDARTVAAGFFRGSYRESAAIRPIAKTVAREWSPGWTG